MDASRRDRKVPCSLGLAGTFKRDRGRCNSGRGFREAYGSARDRNVSRMDERLCLGNLSLAGNRFDVSHPRNIGKHWRVSNGRIQRRRRFRRHGMSGFNPQFIRRQNVGKDAFDISDGISLSLEGILDGLNDGGGAFDDFQNVSDDRKKVHNFVR